MHTENNIRLKIIAKALSLVGEPACNHPKANEDHSLGTLPETGFDCSGLVLHVLKSCGLEIPENLRHASELFDSYGIFAHRGHPGDLVFFSKYGLAPKHAAIMVSENQYVSSQGKDGGKVMIYKLKIKRIPVTSESQLYRINPIGFKMLSTPNGRWQKIIP